MFLRMSMNVDDIKTYYVGNLSMTLVYPTRKQYINMYFFYTYSLHVLNNREVCIHI